MHGQQSPEKWRQQVSDLILGGVLDEASIVTIVDAGLAGYAVQRLSTAKSSEQPPGQLLSTDQRLQHGKLLAAARHATVRRVVLELVTAWRAAGIETLLYKGFMLAEFVYPDTSWRQYSDVDLALRGSASDTPGTLAARAVELAADLGWQVVWRFGEAPSIESHHDSDYNGHELLLLQHLATGVNVDVHRRLVHSNLTLGRQGGKAEAITKRVWKAASEAEFGAVKVWLPAPVDSALIGLIVGRSWSGDRYALRPHDLLDLELLMKVGGLSHEQLLQRARQHGVVRTTKLFLRRCDPLTGTLDLRAPNDAEVFCYDLLLIMERGHRGLQRFVRDLAAFPSLLQETTRELFAALRTGRTTTPARRLDVIKPLDRRTWRRSQAAVRRALRLLGTSAEREPRRAVELLQASLTKRGYDVRLEQSRGRMWLEHDGQALPFDLLGTPDEAEALGALPGWPASGPGANAATTRGAWSRVARPGWRGISLRIEALVRLLEIRRRLRGHTFKEVRAAVLRPVAGRAAGANDGGLRPLSAATPDEPRRIGEAVESAARYVPGAQCLAQSLSAQVMLARRGLPSIIHFGFLRSSETGELEGHAWLEAQGQIVTGDVGLDNFTRTATFESPEPRRSP